MAVLYSSSHYPELGDDEVLIFDNFEVLYTSTSLHLKLKCTFYFNTFI